MQNYKIYIETLDISKFKEYVAIVEEKNEHKIDIEKLKFTKEKEKTTEELKAHYNKYANELGHYVVWSINMMEAPKDKKLQILKYAFPYCYEMLESSIS